MPMSNSQKSLEIIQYLLNQGDLQGALDQLERYLRKVDVNLADQVFLQQARLQRVTEDELRGVLSRTAARAARAEIRDATLSILEQTPIAEPLIPPAFAIDDTLEQPIAILLPDDLGLEKIIGMNNLKEIAWMEQGLQCARSVCRIITPLGAGTGFLIAPDLVMTNNHVLSNPDTARLSKAEFNYQHDVTGALLPTYRYNFDPDRFHTSPTRTFDYTIVGLRPRQGLPELASWGQLTLNPNADLVPNEHVTIIQHPNGAPKQIAVTANQVVGLWEYRLQYSTDTMPGSSGSPVFNDLWQVIAIHHAGGDLQANDQGERRFVNEGILMSAIQTDAGNFWPGN